MTPHPTRDEDDAHNAMADPVTNAPIRKTIPKELQTLVYWAIKCLGTAIRQEYGETRYRRIESIRRSMKSIRSTPLDQTLSVLRKELRRLKTSSDEELFIIAHSFAIMLELINRCESAYRTHRIRQRGHRDYRHAPEASIFVFTAHPTEARSPEILYLFQKITHSLELALQFGTKEVQEQVQMLLRLSLKVPMSRERKPTVRDEAEYLYSFVLDSEILDQQIAFSKRGIPVWFRSWVGGDKDGHPDVDETTMRMSLELSRDRLLDWMADKLQSAFEDLHQIGIQVEESQSWLRRIDTLRSISDGDGRRIAAFTTDLLAFLQGTEQRLGLSHPLLGDVRELLSVYPALVLPLELREDAELVREAAGEEKTGGATPRGSGDPAIVRMLHTLNAISDGLDPKWYARSLILSMVMSADDLQAGLTLVQRHLNGFGIPIVPLLENAQALENAVPILREYLIENPTGEHVRSTHMRKWEGRFEVMLGYSDSSKESGVLSSRYLILGAMKSLDALFRGLKLKPVYFHGSGGSIERGGGSIREQTQWWPVSAVRIFKATVQGEMVARNFGSALVMRSQIEHIMDQLSSTRTAHHSSAERIIKTFSASVQEHYKHRVQQDDFFDIVLQATPYNYLDVLRIGSRPTKRQTASRRLRAIPWVLCWTQTRVLFPTWWGVGSAYQAMDASQKEALKAAYNESPFLSSFVKILGFTLRKVELPIWRCYLDRLDLPKKVRDGLFNEFQAEYERALLFFHELTGEKDLLWHRPWLGESIYFRASMIHPLNLIQIEALKRADDRLLRETVTGIACGMMTTG